MSYYNFYSYEGFKVRLGLEKRENGIVIRKNRISLAHLRNPVLLEYRKEHNDHILLHVYNMVDLQKKTVEVISGSGKNDEKLSHKVELIGETYYSSRHETDKFGGPCENLNKHSVRYINVEHNRVFKMRTGKSMRGLILEIKIGRLLSPCVVNWTARDVFVQR